MKPTLRMTYQHKMFNLLINVGEILYTPQAHESFEHFPLYQNISSTVPDFVGSHYRVIESRVTKGQISMIMQVLPAEILVETSGKNVDIESEYETNGQMNWSCFAF